MAKRKTRTYSDAEKAVMVAYFKQHGYVATQERFKGLGSGTIYGWLRKARGNGMAQTFHRRATAPVAQKKPTPNSAMILLEKWQAAQLAHIRNGHKPNTYDAYAALALLALQESE